ncbi:type II toxin-antitoxin system prevent-host-death family antitoxin (plasmid) [Acuticoccus sp. MNP-M23]|uniref:type II toxin-antitoxin system prevent-host-death family antitoxin n=1 Tax=Acuticoccus sp. MNP-M23 TaxID=3072793 RepID=UPI002814F5E3|nr:type II toxin-antitoxin system prevent-host-death family antitoxin [Acuticoccus sp. MNP-M23]WMS45179.1 type II toxin-antitoxin system prevent-host-death family antitoxin [Acuticoccus sp. MNP-M23]
MKSFRAADLTRNTGDLFEAAAVAPVAITKHRKPRFVIMSMETFEALANGHRTQQSVDVANMPDDLGALLDQGIEDHFNGR